jgi:hypothetical protein
MARARRARPGGGLLAIQDPDGLLAGTGMEEDATGGGFWADLRMEFISSTATLKELTERHPNVALGTLYNHSSREGWEEDRLLWRRNLHAATRTLVMHDQAGEMARAVQAIPLLANDLIQKMMQVVAMTPPQDMSIQDAMALGRVLGTLYQIMKTSVGGVAARPEPRTIEELVQDDDLREDLQDAFDALAIARRLDQEALPAPPKEREVPHVI